MRSIKRLSCALLPGIALALAACGSGGGGDSRNAIRAVGSSTVYPFAKVVSENFARNNAGFASPIIESTGSGGGIKLFCQGVGATTPDIANASRRMKLAEFKDCQANGVTDVIEIQVGLDGLAIATAQGGLVMPLTLETIYRAMAANPYGQPQTARTWADVDPSLPNEPILVYGPPSTSGTRDSFNELILLAGCEKNPEMKALKESDSEQFDRICTEVRSDGAYVDQGENDNLIVQKLQSNPKTIGVFGYSYLEENSEVLQGLSIDGVEPTLASITEGRYPGAREMFMYVKKAHLDAIPGLKEYLVEWTNSWGAGGPLARIGLVVMSEEQLAKATAAATTHTTLTEADFQ